MLYSCVSPENIYNQCSVIGLSLRVNSPWVIGIHLSSSSSASWVMAHCHDHNIIHTPWVLGYRPEPPTVHAQWVQVYSREPTTPYAQLKLDYRHEPPRFMYHEFWFTVLGNIQWICNECWAIGISFPLYMYHECCIYRHMSKETMHHEYWVTGIDRPQSILVYFRLSQTFHNKSLLIAISLPEYKYH